MIVPQLSFRNKTTPFASVTAITFVQSMIGGGQFPVRKGELSDYVYVRIYNNFNLLTAVSTAYNVQITTFDGQGSQSQTAIKTPVTMQMIMIQPTGFGEDTTNPDKLTVLYGTETAIGGSNTYPSIHDGIVYGSNGANPITIRAGSDTNSLGFVEYRLRAHVPKDDVFNNATGSFAFALSVFYEWTS